MADLELQTFYYKFRQIWSHGRRANLTVNCEEGRAWVTLSTDLGPWRLPTHYSRPRPSRPRTTPPAPLPSLQGNPRPPTTTTITNLPCPI